MNEFKVYSSQEASAFMAEAMKAKTAEVTRLAAEVESAEAEKTCLAVATAMAVVAAVRTAMAVVGAVRAFARWRQP